MDSIFKIMKALLYMSIFWALGVLEKVTGSKIDEKS
jgi:hypothetical protein